MKRWYEKVSIGTLLVLSLFFITALLRLSVFDSDDRSLVSSLNNLYLVPILLAAFFWGETGCIVIALLATVGSGIVNQGFYPPTDWAAWSSILIHGAFFVTLGYLASFIAGHMLANSQGWRSLLEISRSINSSLDLDEILNTVTQKSVELTSADACAICLLSEDGEELTFTKSLGLSDKFLFNGPTLIKDNAMVQQIIRDGKLVIHDLSNLQEMDYFEETIEEGIISVMSVPLRIDDKVIGLMNLYRKRSIRFSSQDCRFARTFAQTFAEQVAIALRNARVFASVRKNYLDTVRAFTRAIEAKDSLTLGHSERVARLAVNMAHALHLSPEDIQTIEFGALLHDLGKISLEDQTLIKSGKLSPKFSIDEQVLYEMHPMIAKSILQPVEFLRLTFPILLHHHERWDGQGYPERLAGNDIPLLARIVAVANGFDGIMYQSSPFPLISEEVIEEMRKEAGTVYDADLVEVLASTLPSKSREKTVDETMIDRAV